MQQIWKNVVGYQGLYQVSNLGRVKSLKYKGIQREKIMKQRLNTNGYYGIKLKHCDYKLVHRIVYESFNGKIPDNMQVDHIDANKQNNKLENLQLLTPSENTRKMYIQNTNFINKGGVKRIKIKCLNNGIVYPSINQASRKLNLDTRHVQHVLKGIIKHHKGYKFIYVDDNINSKEQLFQQQLF